MNKKSQKARNKKLKLLVAVILPITVIAVLAMAFRDTDFALLSPQGEIAQKERDLIMLTVYLGLLVVVPVFILTIAIAWRYREGNKKAKYSPDLDGNIFAEMVWWGIPLAIITVLAIVTWNSSHALEPRKKLASDKSPLTVQVVALEWRWLFIYPEQNIATINYVSVPEDRPITFKITADAPMNSFWIPKLGGQIYAMPGMSTELNLNAHEPGIYRGSSANLSGEGFAGMTFDTVALTEADFTNWVDTVRESKADLSVDEYLRISRPSTDKTIGHYKTSADHLYDKVVMKYMKPGFNMHAEYTGHGH